MALEPCVVCGHMVAPKAPRCPECGERNPSPSGKRMVRVWGPIAGITWGIVGVGCLASFLLWFAMCAAIL